MTAKLLLLGVFIFVMIIMSLNHGKRKKRVIFFGDIINDLDTKPGGYISWIADHLKNEGVEDKFTITSSQKAGENIYDMYLRLDDSVLLKDAAIVVIYAGINDVLNKYHSGTGTDAIKFEAFYNAIINKLHAANIKIIVCTPAVQLSGNITENMLHEINSYCDIIHRIAGEHNLPLVDFEKAFALTISNNGEATDQAVQQHTTNYNINKRIADEIWKVLREVRW